MILSWNVFDLTSAWIHLLMALMKLNFLWNHRFRFKSGNLEHPGDIIRNASVEVLPVTALAQAKKMPGVSFALCSLFLVEFEIKLSFFLFLFFFPKGRSTGIDKVDNYLLGKCGGLVISALDSLVRWGFISGSVIVICSWAKEHIVMCSWTKETSQCLLSPKIEMGACCV